MALQEAEEARRATAGDALKECAALLISQGATLKQISSSLQDHSLI
jgi:hypothetical protein